MYPIFLVLIVIACVLIVLTVLAQNPKGGMAANFGASNQVMGVRQTTDFLEKFTWGLAITITVLCLAATMTMPRSNIEASKSAVERSILEAGATQGGNEGLALPAVPVTMPETSSENTPEGENMQAAEQTMIEE